MSPPLVRNLDAVPVTSVAVPVDLSCRYEGLPHHQAFGERVRFVGGINKPKLVVALDSGEYLGGG